MNKVVIEVSGIKLEAVFNDSETAEKILDILPVEGPANVWGEEIYFGLPLHLEESKEAQQEVEIGDLAFWPPGDAFCIFFGPTPVSMNGMPRAYSPVNVFGKITGNPLVLRKVKNGETVKVYKAG